MQPSTKQTKWHQEYYKYTEISAVVLLSSLCLCVFVQKETEKLSLIVTDKMVVQTVASPE